MIEEKEIKVFISSRNITYYRNKGYSNIKHGEDVRIKIEDLNINCKKIVTAVCGCGNKVELKYEKYIINKNRHGYYGCKKCSREKAKITSQEKYGADNYMQTDEGKKRVEDSNLKKYGVKTTLLEEKTKEKIKKTIQKKYGVDEILSSGDVREKSKQTLMKKYGVDHFSKTDIFKKIYSNDLWIKFTIDKLNKYNITNYELDEKNRMILLCCKDYEHNYSITSKNLYQRKEIYKTGLCTVCNPIDNNTVSDKENEIFDFIKKNYDGEIIQSDKNILNGKEIDIYLPELNLAFEYNGVYWHNELYKDKKYHLDKTDVCEEKGIHLVHIYEDDYLNKKEIVLSRIKNLLGKSNKIYARKCIIKNVDSKSVRIFLNKNHIQGFNGSKIKLGLYYENELVSLMTFGSLRRNLGTIEKENSYELLRFCNKLNTTVIGGANRLFKQFIKEYKPNEIISYADRSWSKSSKNLYENLGFKFSHKTVPNYSYVLGSERKNRFNFRKDVLVKEGYDINKSEHQIMFDRGYYRIYDSGSLKYIFM